MGSTGPVRGRKGRRATLLSTERIEHAICHARGERVLLDTDLALLYGVTTRALVQAVKRNVERFPADFLFQLSTGELDNLRSQSVISSALVSWGGRRYRPYAFTEQGVAMLSSVLRSRRAVAVNIEIMRVFVRLRGLLISQYDLSRKIAEMEHRYDGQFRTVFEAIRRLMAPLPAQRRRAGFRTDAEE